MKKLKSLILTFCIFAIGINITMAQDAPVQKFTIKTNPLAALGGPFWVAILPITGEYRALFEAKTTPKQSVTIGASFLGPSLLLNLDELTSDGSDLSGIKTSGVRFQGMYKFFLSRDKEAPEGLYVGPHASYAMATLASKDVSTDKIKANKLNVNGVIGYQLITNGGFALDIFTGLGIKTTKWTLEGDSGNVFDFEYQDKNSASVAFGFNFGYAF